jgi:hypothetical protein
VIVRLALRWLDRALPDCHGVNKDEKSALKEIEAKYYVIIPTTWSHDWVLSEKKSYRHRLPFFLSTTPTYTHNPGFDMSVDLTKLEAHLSTRSYVEG